jgi:hypothetical protein
VGFCRSRLGPATGMVGTHWQSTAGFWIVEEPARSGDWHGWHSSAVDGRFLDSVGAGSVRRLFDSLSPWRGLI